MPPREIKFKGLFLATKLWVSSNCIDCPTNYIFSLFITSITFVSNHSIYPLLWNKLVSKWYKTVHVAQNPLFWWLFVIEKYVLIYKSIIVHEDRDISSCIQKTIKTHLCFFASREFDTPCATNKIFSYIVGDLQYKF